MARADAVARRGVVMQPAMRSALACFPLLGLLAGCVVTRHQALQGDRWALRGDEARLAAPDTRAAPDPLAHLDDEFDDPTTLARWSRLDRSEGWPDQIKRLNIATTSPGQLHFEPYTSFWFANFHAPYLYKEVTGDFVVTTRVEVSGAKDPVPKQGYSLAGLLVRAPHPETAAAWKPGSENWLFITAGTGDGEHIPQYETKNTVDGASRLELTPRPTGPTELRVTRVGPHFTLLRRAPGEDWVVLRRLERPDLPATLQVGPVAYTDFNTSRSYLILGRTRAYHRDAAEIARRGVPDLVARFDYVHFRRP